MKNVKQKDFEKTIKHFKEIEDVRGKIWNMARHLLLKGYEIEACILILATWNFAGFRYFLKKFNVEKFKIVIKNLQPSFEKLKNETFKKVNIDDEKIKREIQEIYTKLKNIVGQTGASKIMALKNPKLFIMWDTDIRKMCKIKNNATFNEYIEFFKKMKKKFSNVKSPKKIPFPKAIDEYNYVKAHKK